MKAVLEFKNYKPEVEGRKLFAPLTYAIFESDFVILRAPSGSGKSKVLEDIVHKTLPEINISSSFSYLPQSLDLVKDISVIQNVQLPYLAQKKWWKTLWTSDVIENERLKSDLSLLGLENFDQKVLTLSGGEQQRLALVRAVQPHKKLWILDEPLSSLDQYWADRALNYLYSSAKKYNCTVLCILHQEVKIPNLKLNTIRWNEKWIFE